MTKYLLPQTSLDLKNCFLEEEVVIKTCQQIDKDMVGLVENHVEFNVNFDEKILDQIIKYLMVNLKKMNHQNLLQFIYLVDLKEIELESNLSRNMGLEDLAFKIIRREAQKVFLRIKYS